MERHEILTNNIDWPELAEGEKPVAMLAPIEPPKTMANLEKALREIPGLGDDAANFEADVQEIRKGMNDLDAPWESK